MALNIDGTTGISGVDGSASAPALQGTDSNTGINFASDTVNINTGGVTRATVDSSGNLGIGDSSPSELLSLKNTSAQCQQSLTAATNGSCAIYFGDTDSVDRSKILHHNNGDYLSFSTAAAERVRINSSGDLLVGTTSSSIDNTAGTKIVFGQRTLNIVSNDSGNPQIILNNVGFGAKQISFRYTNGEVGSISISSTATAYTTSSDYRLKENVVAISDGITRLKTLKPSRFNFIADSETTVDGFLAHEVTAVPEAITGTKDAVDSDNNPVYQGIDQSKLVPLLTAALQEAVAKIEVLETKVAALEAG